MGNPKLVQRLDGFKQSQDKLLYLILLVRQTVIARAIKLEQALHHEIVSAVPILPHEITLRQVA